MLKKLRDAKEILWKKRAFGGSKIAAAVMLSAVAFSVDAAKKEDAVITATEAKKIATDYEKLSKKAVAEGEVSVLVRVPRTGVTEDSAGDYKQGIKDLKKFAKTLDIKVKRSIPRLGIVVFIATPAQLDELLASGLAAVVEEDATGEAMLDVSVPWIGGDVFQTAGHLGNGKAVAIFDTGVDTSHAFFGSRIVEEACFSVDGGTANTLCPNGQTSMFGLGSGDDACNLFSVGSCEHGTHVAGIAAGANASMVGVAPGADIVAVQVFHYNNSLGSMRTAWSDILAGMDWVLNDATSDIGAINLSVGGGLYTSACDSDIMADVVTELRHLGIASVIASGNDYSDDSVSFPGCISSAITVASSFREQDVFSGFSNISPMVDVVAPGDGIYSAIPGGGFSWKSGTSMATPHVAGAVTSLQASFPSATIDDIEAVLESTGLPVVHGATNNTYPRIDLVAALNALSNSNSATYEAEDQTWSNAAVETEHLGFSGTGYVNTVNAAGEWIEFTVNVPVAGSYPVTVTYANGSAARPADISINGEYKVIDPEFTGSGGWNVWGSEAFNVTLDAGINTITLIARGNSGLANIDRLNLVVPQENRAPIVVNPIADINMRQGDASYIINLNTVFADPDGDALYFDKDSSYSDSDNVRFVSATELEINPVELGSEWFEIRAFDDSDAEVTWTFTMTVTAANQKPVVVNPIADITIEQGSASYLIDLNAVFSDPDGDELDFSRDATDDESPNLMFADTTHLRVEAIDLGTVTHHVHALDGNGGFATTSFDLTVVPSTSNQAPVVVNDIADIQMNLGDATITIDLNNVFSDPEGGALTFDHYAMDEELDDVTLFANGTLEVDAEYAGFNTHTIYAFDAQGEEAVLEFNVTVALSSFSIELQAEDQTWLNGTVDSNHAGYTGTGFVNTENVLGTWFEFSVDAPAAGSYTVTVRYANGSTNRSQQVYINGDLGPAVNFNNTGGWSSWGEQSFTVYFENPGVNTVVMESLTSGGAANLDRLSVVLQ